MDLMVQKSAQRFMKNNDAKFFGIYDYKSSKELFSVNESNTTSIIGNLKASFINFHKTKNIIPSFQLDIMSIESQKESTLIKLIDKETIMVLVYETSKIALGELRSFIAKFAIQYNKESSLNLIH